MSSTKSDLQAKEAFVIELQGRGFRQVSITKRPADITAWKNGRVHYFEIKYTAQPSKYFGAATLTEWAAAVQLEDQYRFVVAAVRDGCWVFDEYTPSEFMRFSYIPPFKIFFHVEVGQRTATTEGSTGSRVRLTPARVKRLAQLYEEMRSGKDT